MKRNAWLAVLLLAWLAVAGCAGGAPTPGGAEADGGPPRSETPEQGGPEEPVTSVAAGCALGWRGPEPSQGAPGEAFRVHGEGFTTDCYDTGQPGRPPPQRDISIDLRQGERTWRLATVDADPEGVLDAGLRVPDDAAAGSATVVVRADDGYPVESPFEVLAVGSGTDAGPAETNSAADLAADEEGNLVAPRPPEYRVTDDGNLIIGGDVEVRCAEVGIADETLDRATPAVRVQEEEARNEAIRACRNAGFPTAADVPSGTPPTGGTG